MKRQLKIAHMADLHIWEKYARDCVNSIKFIKNSIFNEEEPYDVVLMAGDITHKALILNEKSPIYQTHKLILEIANKIPVIMIYGNHDIKNSLSIFTNHSESYGKIYIVEKNMETLYLSDEGIYKLEDLEKNKHTVKGVFYCIPYPEECHWLSQEQLGNRGLLDTMIREKLLEEDEKVKNFIKEDIFKIIVAHGNLETYSMCSGQTEIIKNEVDFHTHTLRSINPDYVAMGHIHKKQSLYSYKKACYSGSIYSVDFSEKDTKSFQKVKLTENSIENVPVVIPTRIRKEVKLKYTEGKSISEFQKILDNKVDELLLRENEGIFKLDVNMPEKISKGMKIYRNLKNVKINVDIDEKQKITKESKIKGKTISDITEEWLKNFKNKQLTNSLKDKLRILEERLENENKMVLETND